MFSRQGIAAQRRIFLKKSVFHTFSLDFLRSDNNPDIFFVFPLFPPSRAACLPLDGRAQNHELCGRFSFSPRPGQDFALQNLAFPAFARVGRADQTGEYFCLVRQWQGASVEKMKVSLRTRRCPRRRARATLTAATSNNAGARVAGALRQPALSAARVTRDAETGGLSPANGPRRETCKAAARPGCSPGRW